MNNLRELTKEKHKKVEGTPFIQKMIAGKLTEEEYWFYLYCQYIMYSQLENANPDLHDELKDILRYERISMDAHELGEDTFAVSMNSLFAYIDHIASIKTDRQKLLAHFYVRHMGDLSGGQILKKRVPGSGKMYEFERDVKELKEELHSKLDDSMIDEVNLCFDLIYDFLIELGEKFDTK